MVCRIEEQKIKNKTFQSLVNMHPILPVYNEILLPGAFLELLISTPISIAAVEYHLSSGADILVLPQHTQSDFPSQQELFPFGCRARVLRSLTIGEQSRSILLEGLARIHAEDISLDEQVGYLAAAQPVHDQEKTEEVLLFWMEKLQHSFRALVRQNGEIHPDLLPLLDINISDQRFMNLCCNQLMLNKEKRMILLASTNPIERIQLLLTHIEQESDFQEVNNKVIEHVQGKIEQQNRAYFVKNQIHTLQEELEESNKGDTLIENRELQKLQQLFTQNPPPLHILEEIHSELNRLSKMPIDSSEYNIGKNWLSALSKLPWNSAPPKDIDIEKAEQVLNKDHHGLEKIKERIIEQLAVQKLKGEALGTVLCLVGPPGTGKTSLSKSIAHALGRPFERISLAGIKDEAEIRGHRRTYIGSMPGRFIRAMQKSKTKSPLILLDEIDKIGRDVRGDPSSALLEILDPEQNDEFVDHYIDVPFDFSHALFICTANTLDTIDPALIDRLEILELNSYTREEKQEIVIKHLLPKIAADHAIMSININHTLLPFLIDGYTREAGLRRLSQKLSALARKTAIAQLKNKTLSIQKEDQLRDLLGPELPPPPPVHNLPVGQSLGLAWTPVGGEVLRLQAIVHKDGSGKTLHTGNLGTVMKESIDVAYAYISAHHNNTSSQKQDLHLHVPQGAISKDGPSAGMAIAMAIYGAIHSQAILAGVAMTGELDLSGHIGAIGGLKEKILAAYRMEIPTILIPKENEHELVEIPSSIRDSLIIHCIQHLDEALEFCFPNFYAQKNSHTIKN
jgi:ATP-dependent Lon protease